MKKIIKKAVLFVIGISCLTGAIVMPTGVQANEIQKEKEVPVYTVNEEGDIVLSEVDSNLLLQMMDEKSGVATRQIPGPEGNAVRIGSIQYGTIDRAAYAGKVLGFAADVVWSYYGGKIVSKITQVAIGKAIWDASISNVSTNLINKFTNGNLRVSYSAGYMYKTWNSYYKVYDIFYCEAQYSDSSRTRLEYFVHFPVGTTALK